MKIELTQSDVRLLIDIIHDDIAMSEHDTPDYTDPDRMKYLFNRAHLLKDIKESLEAARNAGIA